MDDARVINERRGSYSSCIGRAGVGEEEDCEDNDRVTLNSVMPHHS